MATLREAAPRYDLESGQARIILRSFADLLSDVQVEMVLATQEDGLFSLWSVANSFTEASEDQIYAVEGMLMDQFPHISFDFHLLEQRGQPLDALISIEDFLVHPIRSE